MSTVRAIRGSTMFVGVALALATKTACAAALGSFATSLGVFAALAALFVIKGWPAHFPPSALSTVGTGLVLVAAGVAWFWRARPALRLPGLTGAPPSRQRRTPLPSKPLIELPAGLDRDTLLADMRRHFVRLQEAWDHGDTETLNQLATPHMLAEFRLELPACAVGAPGQTEIVTLCADLLGFERVGQALVVSVEFSGSMRESTVQGTIPFRELWLLTQSDEGSAGWRLARHQALL